MLSSKKLTKQLKALIERHAPVRLTINKKTGGMCLDMGNDTQVLLGVFRFMYSQNKLNTFKIPLRPLTPHKMVQNPHELTK
jgi:hypothetical protein